MRKHKTGFLNRYESNTFPPAALPQKKSRAPIGTRLQRTTTVMNSYSRAASIVIKTHFLVIFIVVPLFLLEQLHGIL